MNLQDELILCMARIESLERELRNERDRFRQLQDRLNIPPNNVAPFLQAGNDEGREP